MSLLSLPLHVLMTAPRPLALDDLPSRARTEAFYDALEGQGDATQPEWLWRGSWSTLADRLSSKEKAPIAALFLDALLVGEGEDAAGASDADTVDRPALWFEDAGLMGQRVSVRNLGTLLAQMGVSLLILAVAPTAAASDAETLPHLGAALTAAGLAHALILGPDLAPAQVVGAMGDLLAALVAGRSVAQAVADATAHQSHAAWALYQAGEDAALVKPSIKAPGVSKVVRFPGGEAAREEPGAQATSLSPAWRRLPVEPEVGGLPPEPQGPADAISGFVGRGHEMALLEKALCGDPAELSTKGNGIVLVHGLEGIGKTTLVAHAARWFVRTGRFQRLVYTNFVGGGYPETAIFDLGLVTLGQQFNLRHGDPVAAVERALAETPTLIVWDHLEAVLPGGDYALPQGHLDELLQLGTRFAQAGESRLVVISENAQLPDPAYQSLSLLSLCLEVRGLLPVDARALLAPDTVRLADEAAADGALAELATHLGGHPLALSTLRPLLAERSPGQVLETLEGLLPGLRQGDALLRNQALELTMQALLLSIPEDLRDKMASLGLFVGGMMQPMTSTGAGLEASDWSSLRQVLLQARLMREERLAGFAVPFVRFHPALTRHLSLRLAVDQRLALAEKYCGSYMGLAGWLQQNERRTPEAVMALARRELPNLRHALQLMLDAQRLDTANDYGRQLLRLLEILGYQGERDAVREKMGQAIVGALSTEEPLARPQVLLLINQGEYLLGGGRLAEAATVFQQLAQRMEQEKGLSYSGDDARYDQAIVLHRLGRCLRGSGRPDAAGPAFFRAREILSGMIGNRSLQRELLAVCQDLGEVLILGLQIDPAVEVYAQALNLASELEDHRALAAIESARATIAMAHDDVEGARLSLQRALEQWAILEDKAGMAGVWLQLGAVARRVEDLADAERCYREALHLAEEAAHLPRRSQALAELAQVLEEAQRYPEAEEVYMQAIGFYQEHNQRHLLSRAESALANLLLRRGQLQNARIHAEAARAVVENLGPEGEPWQTYTLLQHIAAAEGEGEREAHWRARAQESYASSPQARQMLQQWKPIIQGIARACRGEALESATVELLEDMEKKENWSALVATMWRILGGERGPELRETLDFVDALVVQRLLQLIDTPESEWEEEEEEKSTQADINIPAVGLTVSQLLKAAVVAAGGNQSAQMFIMQALTIMTQQGAGGPWPRFAASVAGILQGERDMDSLQEGLSAELGQALQALVRQLDRRKE